VSVSVSRRVSARAAAYASAEVSDLLRSRRRWERQERREGRLRKLKNKIDMVFHHRHDHHYFQEVGPSSRRPCRDHHHKSPWPYLRGILHRKTRQDKKPTSATVVSTPAKSRGGQMHASFVSVLRRKLREPASTR